MSKKNDRILENIACIDTANLQATLISTLGNHCDVWRSIAVIVHGPEKIPLDIVIKRHRQQCSFAEARVLQREYREIKSRLGDMAPNTIFVMTEIDRVDNVVVIAEAVTSWFNIANPANEEETIPLLRQLPQTRTALKTFTESARFWQWESGKIIDLYGIDNLILDINRQLKYVDSFNIFFYEDILDLFDGSDYRLQNKIDISLQRLDYLEYLSRESGISRIPPMTF